MATLEASGTLAELLKNRKVLPPGEALRLIRDIAAQAAGWHAAGRLHGDIRAETIALDRDGRPSLIGQPRESSPAGTRPADSTSTRRRCPQRLLDLCQPQEPTGGRGPSGQIDPDDVPAADVRSLGALLCRLLTGTSGEAYLCSSRIKAQVPEALQPFLDRILTEQAAAPVRNATEFLEALDAALATGPRETAAPADERESSLAAVVETVDVDSSCVSGIEIDPRGRAVTNIPFDVGDLPFQKLGHYEITGRLGRGGMGEVYLGYDRGLDRRVAIKVLPAEFARDPELVRRFQAEATAAARLVHPNIIQIYFIGEDAGHHFFAMQYVEGMPLSRFLARGRLTISEAVAIAEEMLSGLAAAHRLSLVHRDIKPANILLDSEHRRALLADFGLVKSLAEAAREQTATGVVMGTADYMSPEQALGRHVDCRSDLYSAGVVVYQMLCGRLPFVVRESAAVIYHHVHVAPPPLAEVAPEVPEPLAAVVARLLAKSPDDRYQSAGAALADLRAACSGGPLSAGAVPTGDDRQPGARSLASQKAFDTSPVTWQPTLGHSPPASARESTAKKLSRRQAVALLAGGAAIASALGAGLLSILRGPESASRKGLAEKSGSGRNAAEILAIRDIASEVNCFAITSDERTLVTGDRAEKLSLFDFQTGEPGRTLRAHSGPVRRVILTADGRHAVTASGDQTLKLWNTTTWRQVTQFNGHVDVVSSVVEVPERAEIISSSFDGRLCRWSLQDGSPIAWYGKDPIDPQEIKKVDPESQDRHVSWVRDLVIPSPGKQVISAGNDRVILIWNVDSAEVVDRLIGHRQPVMCLAASRDGTRLISGGYDKLVCVWDIPQRRLLHRIPHERATPACVAFSPDATMAAAGGADGLIHFWDVETAAERATLETGDGTVTSIRFLDDGRRIVSGSEDRTVRVWNLGALGVL